MVGEPPRWKQDTGIGALSAPWGHEDHDLAVLGAQFLERLDDQQVVLGGLVAREAAEVSEARLEAEPVLQGAE